MLTNMFRQFFQHEGQELEGAHALGAAGRFAARMCQRSQTSKVPLCLSMFANFWFMCIAIDGLLLLESLLHSKRPEQAHQHTTIMKNAFVNR